MAVTHIITIVTEDDYPLDSEALYDRLDEALAESCGCATPGGTCSLLVASMRTFKHTDDEFVDWEPAITKLDDDWEGGTPSPEGEV